MIVSSRKVFALLAFGLILICFATNSSRRHSVAFRTPVSLDPVLPQSPRAYREPEVVEVVLLFKNLGRTSLNLLQVTGTCGCMAFTASDGSALDRPRPVAAGETFPIHLALNSRGKSGKTDYGVHATYAIAGVERVIAANVSVDILPALRLSTTSFNWIGLVPGQGRAATVSVYDGYPDPGIGIKEVRVSDPRRIRAELFDPPPERTAGVARLQSATLKLRKSLVVTLRPQFAPCVGLETITLIPREAAVEPHSLTVSYSFEDPSLSISPRSITFHTRDLSSPARRRISCKVQGKSAADFRVFAQPDFLSVHIRPSGRPGFVWIDVDSSPSHSAPHVAPSPGSQLEIVVAGRPDRIIIPIKILGDIAE